MRCGQAAVALTAHAGCVALQSPASPGRLALVLREALSIPLLWETGDCYDESPTVTEEVKGIVGFGVGVWIADTALLYTNN